MLLLRIFSILWLFLMAAHAAPIITGFTGQAPTVGQTIITVQGSGLGDAEDGLSQVQLGATSIDALSQNGTTLTFTLPPGQGTGILLSVIDAAGMASNSFVFAYDAPSISSFSAPPVDVWSTLGGQNLVIDGLNFGTTGLVTVGGAVASQVSYDQTSITVTTPPGVGADLPVVVTVGGQSSGSVPFSYSAPVVDDVSPPSGIAAEGGVVVITGSDFGFGEPEVLFGDVPGVVTAFSPESITVTKPETVVGVIGLFIIQNGGRQSIAISFGTLTSAPGYYLDLNNVQVLPAPPGTFTSVADASAAQLAPRGHYTPLQGMQAAIPASPGYFVDSEGASQQTPAPLGRFTAGFGSTAAVDAAEGTYVPVTGMRTAIPASPGYYVDSVGASAQTVAGPGRVVDSVGAMAATPTEPGTYAPVAGMRQAIPASPGYFVPLAEATGQTPSPVGAYVDLPGQVEARAADFGSYVPVAGMQAQLPAVAGYFVSQEGQSTQTASSPGDYVPVVGSTSSIPAAAGRYAPIAGMQSDIAAPPGTYVPFPGSTALQLVPAGFTTDAGGGGGGTSLVPLPQTEIVAYTLEANGDNTISFQSANGQNYALFYTENLVDFTMLITLPGSGGVVTHTFTPPVSTTGRRFYVVGPIDLPTGP